jgi:TPR repeat protein
MSPPSIEELDRLAGIAYGELVKKNYQKSRELYEELYRHAPDKASVHLGFIHSQKDIPDYNVDKAFDYLGFAAEANDIHAMCYLGYLLDGIGRRSEAIEWWLRASDEGHGDSTRAAAWALHVEGDIAKADKLFERAASQGDASAIQIIAIRKIKGRDGFREIASGLTMLVKNIPRIFRYIRERV